MFQPNVAIIRFTSESKFSYCGLLDYTTMLQFGTLVQMLHRNKQPPFSVSHPAYQTTKRCHNTEITM